MFFWRGITIFFIIFFLIYNTLILDISFENVVNSLNSNSSPITFLINWGGGWDCQNYCAMDLLYLFSALL